MGRGRKLETFEDYSRALLSFVVIIVILITFPYVKNPNYVGKSTIHFSY